MINNTGKMITAKGVVSLSVIGDDGDIKQEVDRHNTWSKHADWDFFLNKHDLLSVALFDGGDVQRPFASSDSDKWVYGLNFASMGSLCIIEDGKYVSSGHTTITLSGTAGPSSIVAGEYDGITLMSSFNSSSFCKDTTSNKNINSSYNDNKIWSIIRFPSKLAITSSDSLIWTYTIYYSFGGI